MNVTIVYYTNCLAPKSLIRRTLGDAMSVADKNGWNLAVSSHFPLLEKYEDCSVSFHHLACDSVNSKNLKYLKTWEGMDLIEHGDNCKNIVTGILTYSFETILTQIVSASEAFPSTDIVILWEHDVIYPEGYAESMVQTIEESGVDYAVYENHIFLDDEGFFKPEMKFWYLSRYAGRKDAMVECFESKIELDSIDILEPVLEGLGTDDSVDTDSDSYKIITGRPVIDVRHGSNASGQILVNAHIDSVDYWGEAEQYSSLIMDSDYIEYVTSRPEVGYGLFISGQSFFL